MKRTLEQELILWKGRKEHLPILLRGARQVGKSYLVEVFGKNHFDDVAVVDFENRPELKEAFRARDPKEILTQLEFALRKPIKAGQTLLFLDEIQSCPEALIALRYFKEKMPELHVIAAGSLLEFLLSDQEYSFPVGRVEFLYLRPLSFIEYLNAVSPLMVERLQNFDLKHPPSELEHRELLKLIRKYLFVGGMPSAVQESLQGESLLETQRVHFRILQAYESDFGKYSKQVQHKYLRQIFMKAPSLIAQILKFSRIDKESRSRELKPALDQLCYAGIFQRIYATTAAGLPLHAHMKEDRFKLLYLDTGLLQTATRVDATLFLEQDILQINQGMIAEQFVGQELLAYAPPYQNTPLLFWERNGAVAEVDYVMAVGSEIIPIEVKSGVTGSLRSMHAFIQEKKSRIGVRISEHPLSLRDNILSIPFYLIGSVEQLVRSCLIYST